MKDSTSPHPAQWQETEHLQPMAERELPPGRHEFHKERLMAQIHDEIRSTTPEQPSAQKARSRFLRPVIALPLAACAVAGAIVAGTALTGQDSGGDDTATRPAMTTDIGNTSTAGTEELLGEISLAAGKNGTPKVRQDQFLYIESYTADTHVKTVDDEHKVVSQEPQERRVWKSPDGKKGWLIGPGSEEEGGETLDSPHAGTGAYNELTSLPTDPDALLKRIYKDSEGQGNGRDQAAFDRIGELIGESYPPAGLEAALYKAAAKIPGVVTVNDAEDVVGRSGVAVARLDEFSGQRSEWIFSEKTHVFLGERTVQVKHGKHSNAEDRLIKPGTVVFSSAVKERAVVDHVKEVPSGKG